MDSGFSGTFGGHVLLVSPVPLCCQRWVEHKGIDGTLSFTHPYTPAPLVSFTEYITRHCSVEQCTQTDRLMELNMNTHAYTHTGNLALSKASFLYKPIHSFEFLSLCRMCVSL